MAEDPTPNYAGLTELMATQAADKAAAEAAQVEVESIQVIGLQLGSELFVLDILYVREIVQYKALEITRVPHAHPYVLGVVNLRGKVLPIMDLSQCLGLGKLIEGENARTIVVEIGDRILGYAVDQVSQVLHLPKDQIQPPNSNSEHLVGVAMVDQQIMGLLDLKKLVSA